MQFTKSELQRMTVYHEHASYYTFLSFLCSNLVVVFNLVVVRKNSTIEQDDNK